MSSTEGIHAIVKSTVYADSPNDNDTLTDANVCLYENGLKVARLIYTGDSEYILPADSFSFKRNTSYSIEVSASGYETARTIIQELLDPPVFDTVRVFTDLTNASYSLLFDFDKTNALNFHTWDYVVFGEKYSGEIYDTGIIPKYFYENSGFNQKISVEIKPVRNEVDSVHLYFYNLSDDFAYFLESYLNYEISYGDFSYEKQYAVESQVENGFGFFASYEKVCVTWINNTDNETNR
ncbi:MAG: hypothetical protein JXR50_03845 [Prolixibacteraceae bacterium]|nr:hypothetical protein [Prolixibacteraceae bacterium]